MQIFAFDEKEVLISALQAERKKDYICPECQEVVRSRGGQFKRAHFFHIKTNISCRLGKKTLQHLSIQLYFESILSNCSLEVPFPTIKRIADIVWESEKIVFEVQVSPISDKEIRNRIRDYASAGYKVIWILHDKTFNQKRVTIAESYLQKFSHYYSNIDLNGKGFIYDQHSRIKKGVFIEKTAPFPIDPSKVFQPPFKKVMPQRKLWSISFMGDLLYDSSKIILTPVQLGKRNYFCYLTKFWDYILKKAC